MKNIFVFILVFQSSCFLRAQPDSLSDPLQSMVLSVCSKVENENRFAGNMNPESAASLPFGIVKEIGTTRYVIAIDSAKFRTGGATFSAFMAMEFPGSAQKICFAAQDIAFNPKGVLPGPNTKLLLVSQHRISLGPHVTMVLKPDGQNYVEWDCNGFQSVNLSGYFEFDPGMIFPDPDVSTDTAVRAHFQVHVNDIHNFVVQTSISPFCIRGISDVSFTVLDAVADFSELSNAPGMNFPAGYDLGNCNGDPLMWTGFYFHSFRVKLPHELSKNGHRAEIVANDLLIDNSGVSGMFRADNLFSCANGSMNGWNFSVNSFGVTLVSNHVNGGSLGGYIKLPLSETDSLHYSACVSQNTQSHELDYAFSVSPSGNFNAQVFSATLTLNSSSQLTVTKHNGKFYPVAQLDGVATFRSANVKARGLQFQQLTIAAEAPVLRGGVFSLTPLQTDSNHLAGFSLGFNSIQAGMLNEQPAIAFSVAVNFTEPGSIDLGATAGFSFLAQTNTVTDAAGGENATKTKWEFDRVKINDIGLAFHTGPFHLDGNLIFKDNDPVYGRGFYGQIAMTIEKVMSSPASAAVWFGRVNGLRYFYADASVPFVVPFGAASIYRFMGGIYYHMHRSGNSSPETQLYSSAFGNAATYVPDPNTSLGIKAGVTVGTSGNPKSCNGDVALEMNFNSNGGINFLSLSGNVFFMTGITERQNKSPDQLPAVASMVMQYDFVNDALHAVLGVQIHLPGISAGGQAVLHYDPETWYLYIGRPQTRINVNVGGIATFNAYFETGKTLDPVPPPPSNVTSVIDVSSLNNARNPAALAAGGGVAFGAGFGCGFNGDIGFEHFQIYYGFAAGVGFDVMVLDYGPYAHCENSASVVGFNGWYAGGQIYAYLQGDVGIRGRVAHHDFDFNLISLSAAALLEARLPNPTWVGGAMGCDYDILGGLVSGYCDFEFQLGNQCNILSN